MRGIFRPALGKLCATLAFFLPPTGLCADASPVGIDSRPVEDPAASEVLNRWILALGLGDPLALRALRTLDAHSHITRTPGEPPIALHVRALKRGEHYRLDYTLPNGDTNTEAYDGMTRWQYHSRLGFGLQSAEGHRRNLLTGDFTAPLRVGSRFPERTRLPDETIAGRRLQVLRMQPVNGRPEKWYFDPATGFRVRVELSGDDGPAIVDFGDFRKVFGADVMEPYRIFRQDANGRQDLVVDVILYNEEMDDALFSPSPLRQEENAQIEDVLSRNHAFMHRGAPKRIETRITNKVTRVLSAGAEVNTTVYEKRPNLVVLEEESAGTGKSWKGFDGRTGWAWSEIEGFRQLKATELSQIASSVDLDGSNRLAALCPLRRWLGEEPRSGRTLIGIALADPQAPVGTFYFDAHTYELVELATTVQAGADGRLDVTIGFADYRPVDGIMIPFTTTITNPALRLETKIQSVKHNVPLDDALFWPKKD